MIPTDGQRRSEAEVVVFLDANMPDVRGCRRDASCEYDAGYFCKHRFNPKVWLIGKCHEKRMMRMKDLGVACEFFAEIRTRWQGEGAPARRFILATHDQTFVQSAQREYRGRHACGMYPLTFGETWIRSGSGPHAITIEVLVIAGGYRDRDHDLLAIRTHASALPARP